MSAMAVACIRPRLLAGTAIYTRPCTAACSPQANMEAACDRRRRSRPTKQPLRAAPALLGQVRPSGARSRACPLSACPAAAAGPAAAARRRPAAGSRRGARTRRAAAGNRWAAAARSSSAAPPASPWAACLHAGTPFSTSAHGQPCPASATPRRSSAYLAEAGRRAAGRRRGARRPRRPAARAGQAAARPAAAPPAPARQTAALSSPPGMQQPPARARAGVRSPRKRAGLPGRSLGRGQAPAPASPTFRLSQPGPGGWLREECGQQRRTPHRAPHAGSAVPGRGRHLRLEVVTRLGLVVAELGLDGHLRLVVLEHHVVVAHVGLRARCPPRQAGRARGGRGPPRSRSAPARSGAPCA